MKALSIDLEALVRYNLSPNQYVFLFLTHARQYAALYKFVQEGPGFSSTEIDDLVGRGYILNLNKSGYYYVDLFLVSDQLGNDLFEQDTEKAALEFWNTYPIQIFDRARNETFSLLTTNKEKFLEDYYLKVGHSAEKHARVMDALHFAIDRCLIDMTIRQWFDSEQWEAMHELKGLSTLAI